MEDKILKILRNSLKENGVSLYISENERLKIAKKVAKNFNKEFSKRYTKEELEMILMDYRLYAWKNGLALLDFQKWFEENFNTQKKK